MQMAPALEIKPETDTEIVNLRTYLLARRSAILGELAWIEGKLRLKRAKSRRKWKRQEKTNVKLATDN